MPFLSRKPKPVQPTRDPVVEAHALVDQTELNDCYGAQANAEYRQAAHDLIDRNTSCRVLVHHAKSANYWEGDRVWGPDDIEIRVRIMTQGMIGIANDSLALDGYHETIVGANQDTAVDVANELRLQAAELLAAADQVEALART